MDVDTHTAVPSNDVPLVDQAFITTTHTVRAESILEHLSFTIYFFLLSVVAY